MGQLIVFFGMIAMYIIGIITGFDFDEDTPIDELQEMCPEIDELCEEDFLNLCELSYPEIIEKYMGYNSLPEWFCEDHDCYCEDDESGMLLCHYYFEI